MPWGRKAVLLDLVKDLRCINAKYLSKPKSFVVNDKRQAVKSGSTKSSYWLIVDDEKKYQKAVTFSNGQTRQLINILLHETRVEGDRGIIIPFRCIRFAPAQCQSSQSPRQDEGTSFWADPRAYGLFTAPYQLHRVPPLQNEAGIPSKRSRGRVSSGSKAHFFINQNASLV